MQNDIPEAFPGKVKSRFGRSLPEYFIRHIGCLVTKPASEEKTPLQKDYEPREPLRCHRKKKDDFNQLLQAIQKFNKRDEGQEASRTEESKSKDEISYLYEEPSELVVSLSGLISTALAMPKVKYDLLNDIAGSDRDLTGLELTPLEKDKIRQARAVAAKEEVYGPTDKVQVEIFVQKTIEQNGIVIFASSKCPFCARLQYLFEMHDRSYKFISLDRMGEYGRKVFSHIQENWMEIKVPNFYFHGRHLEGELPLEKEIAGVNALHYDSAVTDPNTYDLIVVGGGPAGIAAALKAGELKKKVCLIDCIDSSEKRPFWVLGKTGLNFGSLPKRYLYQAAVDLFNLRQASCTAKKGPNLKINWYVLVNEIWTEMTKLNWEFRVSMRKAGVCYLNSDMVLLDSNTVEISNQQSTKYHLKARFIILAVNAKAYIPQIPGAEHCISSDDIFLQKRLPGKVLIVGGSPTAVEYAFILRQIGFPVTLMVAGSLLPLVDKEMVDEIVRKLKLIEVEILMDCLILRVDLLKRSSINMGARTMPDLSEDISHEREISISELIKRYQKDEGPKDQGGPDAKNKKLGKEKKGKGKNNKGKKGKDKKGKTKKDGKNKKSKKTKGGNKKAPKKAKKEKYVEKETDSQKALRQTNQNLFKIISKIMAVKKLAGPNFAFVKRRDKCPSFEDLPELAVIGIYGDGKLHKEIYNTIVVAAGEVTSTKCYGFKNAGININIGSGKIITNENDETNIPNIYAVGDIVEGKNNGTSSAVSAATHIVKRLFGKDKSKVNYLRSPEVILIPPIEYSQIGLTEETARSTLSGEVRVYRQWFWPLGSSFSPSDFDRSLIKLITLKTKPKNEELVGVHVLGRDAEYTVQGLVLPMRKGLYLDDLERLIPTVFTNLEALTLMDFTKSEFYTEKQPETNRVQWDEKLKDLHEICDSPKKRTVSEEVLKDREEIVIELLKDIRPTSEPKMSTVLIEELHEEKIISPRISGSVRFNVQQI